jgi:hypothetical protein
VLGAALLGLRHEAVNGVLRLRPGAVKFGQLAVNGGVCEVKRQRLLVGAGGGVDELAVQPRGSVGEGRLGGGALWEVCTVAA